MGKGCGEVIKGHMQGTCRPAQDSQVVELKAVQAVRVTSKKGHKSEETLVMDSEEVSDIDED